MNERIEYSLSPVVSKENEGIPGRNNWRKTFLPYDAKYLGGGWTMDRCLTCFKRLKCRCMMAF